MPLGCMLKVKHIHELLIQEDLYPFYSIIKTIFPPYSWTIFSFSHWPLSVFLTFRLSFWNAFWTYSVKVWHLAASFPTLQSARTSPVQSRSMTCNTARQYRDRSGSCNRRQRTLHIKQGGGGGHSPAYALTPPPSVKCYQIASLRHVHTMHTVKVEIFAWNLISRF